MRTGARTLLAITAVLLAALAVVQYRWAARVAAADAQREREHLDSAAALFASEFNGIAAQAAAFLQNDAWAAVRSHQSLAAPPALLSEIYYIEIPANAPSRTERLQTDGRFAAADRPAWVLPHCAAIALEDPPAIVSPIFDFDTVESEAGSAAQIVRAVRRSAERCFVARLDVPYLRDTLLPQLVRKSFGATAAADYDFAVVSRPGRLIYGRTLRADVSKEFFSIPPSDLAFGKPRLRTPPGGRTSMIVQHVESSVVTESTVHVAVHVLPLFGPGIWRLDIAHKDLPLAAAFGRQRIRNLAISLALEALLLAAIVFLLAGARRMQRLADQKMQFVAGVSHELRTPVSAITMLSRNQADGLVSGPQQVKQYGELIHQQSRRLNEMVEQTLQYAGIHSGLRRPAKDHIDLRALIQETVDARRDEFSAAGFTVETALPPALPPVFGDPHWLRTALDNLLSNAQKHAFAGRWIRVAAEFDGAVKEVRISVEDRGAGIPPADQSEVFEPFYRGRAAVDQQIPGSGLGLSLVRSAAQAHHGAVTLISEPGRGSTFTMHLPV
jgi:two-component system sensor histidine kinase SenX3